jgi:hypothetical protein
MSNSFFKKYILILSVFSTIVGFSNNHVPPQPRRDNPPVGLDIDNNIFLLFALLLMFGLYRIYQKNQKASI